MACDDYKLKILGPMHKEGLEQSVQNWVEEHEKKMADKAIGGGWQIHFAFTDRINMVAFIEYREP